MVICQFGVFRLRSSEDQLRFPLPGRRGRLGDGLSCRHQTEPQLRPPAASLTAQPASQGLPGAGQREDGLSVLDLLYDGRYTERRFGGL